MPLTIASDGRSSHGLLLTVQASARRDCLEGALKPPLLDLKQHFV
jgi:hypothetical protein